MPPLYRRKIRGPDRNNRVSRRDGNGRTGRLIMNLELIRHGYPAINVKFADRKRYYNAFDSFYRDNNSEPMINLVAEYVSERYDDYFRVLDNE